MAKRKPRSSQQDDEQLVNVVEQTQQAQDFLEKNGNLLFGILAVAVLLIGGIFAYNNFYKLPQQKEAVQQMAQAQYQFERDSFSSALTNPGGGFMGFLDIIDSYGSTTAGNAAKYYAGVSYLNLGKYQAAIDYLDQFDADGEILPIMKYGALGDAYAELNDLGSALGYYEDAVSAGGIEALQAYYLKKIGMLNEKQGNYAAALDAYQQIKSNYPTSPDGRDIEKYIMRVETKS
ncbi:MAG: tetratricopeptide repeat protein [Saprospiraceae bacterium]